MSLLDAAGVVTGDIWCSGAFSFDSPLKDLLDSGEYTLEQLLAEDELLQELRGMHPQLIEFLSSEESVTKLIQYVILPSESTPPISFSSYSQSAAISGDTGEEDTTEETTGKTAESATEENSDDNIQEELNEPERSKDENGKKQHQEEEPKTPKEPGKWLQGEDPVDEQHPAIPPKTLTEQEEKDALYVRFPYMACEVICCEIKGIIDILVDGFVPSSMNDQIKKGDSEEQAAQSDQAQDQQQAPSDPRGMSILDLLFSILYESKPGEIDDYRAGYFDKILSVLFRKRPQAMSQYLNEGGGRGRTVLMAAMFKHLYSHSIMQIVQRLLLPQPPLPPKPDDDEENEEGEDLFADTMEGADIDGLGSFRCNWSESEVSLEMLLDCLISKKIAPELVEDDERKLNLYQNASEVLITIIQNSPLTSTTLHSLTTDPVLDKLILAATSLEEGTEFSHHDSRLTCAMNVLESLILQLGGYGSVGSMIYPGAEEDEEAQQMQTEPQGEANKITEEENGGERSDARQNLSADEAIQHQSFASSDTLIQHLPNMLASLSILLLYEGSEKWVSPMQFSRTKPQKILGSSRLRIVRLLESLVLLGDPSVDSLLCESSCLEICLDLFWKFQWCSMLHQSVANLLVHIFEGQNTRSELQTYFIEKCNLLGRLMDSFWEGTENAKVSENLMAQKRGENLPPASSIGSEKGSSDDVLPISDDDVDAAMEQQEASASTSSLEIESAKAAGENDDINVPDVPDHAPPQSFRLGYMGHVIIICQALVHACTNEGKSESPSLAGGAISEEMNGELEKYVYKFNGDHHASQPQAEESLPRPVEREKATDSVATEETPSSAPLVLAQLVDSHKLSKSWQEFVSTTLASETAIQSTPLGGFQGASHGMDPLHAHRPDDDDDGAAPPLPPRGLLVGGDVIDMDDNDLDVAASMMAGLSLRRGPDQDGDGRPSQDMLSGIPRQGNGPAGGGYMFDDPLGDGRFGKFDEDGDDDSSSDEESELSGNTGDSGGAVADGVVPENSSEDDAPVMDLFAGNLDAFEEKNSGEQENTNWSDFANFDDAFAGAQNVDDNPVVETKSNFDDVFAEVKDHAILLEELDNPPSYEKESPEKPDRTEGDVLSENPAGDEKMVESSENTPS